MPPFFIDTPTMVACVLIMAVAHMIYATVGFGAGMFAVSLMAMLIPDLPGVVVVLLLLSLVAEVWVLSQRWRLARRNLLSWLAPGMVVGLWLGTQTLLAFDVTVLKRALGVVVFAAGLYFLWSQGAVGRRAPAGTATTREGAGRRWVSLPVGLLSGYLGGLFGTGGPPVIVYLRSAGLDKGAFRSTILLYFFAMSLLRAGSYATAGIWRIEYLLAAAILLPGAFAGVLLGMVIHDRVSERRFGQMVSALLVVIGVLLVVGAGR